MYLEITIPVKEIIKLKLGLDIFPFPRLYKDHGLNGFPSKDMSTIHVDEVQYNQYNDKYRYTLAHELGHYVLHKICYDELTFQSADEYANWRNSIPAEEINWLETQGEWFASQLLVPSKQLMDVCNVMVTKHKKEFKKLASIPDDI